MNLKEKEKINEKYKSNNNLKKFLIKIILLESFFIDKYNQQNNIFITF